MPSRDNFPAVLPSLLDRLTAPDDGRPLQRVTLSELAQAVDRDMEDLLNTRATTPDAVLGMKEASQSLLAYGLPDLSTLDAHNELQRAEIGRLVEEAVRKFEPRLTDIRATLLDDDERGSRHLHFRIEARLRIEPAPELVFDTVLDLATGHYSIEASEP